ncbi:hypothetical protein Pcinc_036540, partial [Petrolisthes cinctipes]
FLLSDDASLCFSLLHSLFHPSLAKREVGMGQQRHYNTLVDVDPATSTRPRVQD